MSSELRNQLPERAVLVAELLGDLLLRASLEEHGTQCLIAAVIWMRGSGKELPIRSTIHHSCSLGM
jgi:hypothetical protein